MEVDMLTTKLQLTTLDREFKCNILFHIHHKNGVDERKNCTLKEIENCMIQSKVLSPHFWAKVVDCENYIVNCTSTNSLKDITP
jgi:hypothetical protein